MTRSDLTSANRFRAALLMTGLVLTAATTARPAEDSGLVDNQVDWAAFLARHDLVWDRPGKNYFEAPFVGNGLLGAMI